MHSEICPQKAFSNLCGIRPHILKYAVIEKLHRRCYADEIKSKMSVHRDVRYSTRTFIIQSWWTQMHFISRLVSLTVVVCFRAFSMKTLMEFSFLHKLTAFLLTFHRRGFVPHVTFGFSSLIHITLFPISVHQEKRLSTVNGTRRTRSLATTSSNADKG